MLAGLVAHVGIYRSSSRVTVNTEAGKLIEKKECTGRLAMDRGVEAFYTSTFSFWVLSKPLHLVCTVNGMHVVASSDIMNVLKNET